MSNVLTVNGTIAPGPTVFNATVNPQQKSAERNGNGTLIRETLPDKWSIDCEWEFGTPQEFYNWFNTLRTLTRINFPVSFPAPSGVIETATFYISPISCTMINFAVGASGWWKPMKCSFVEV